MAKEAVIEDMERLSEAIMGVAQVQISDEALQERVNGAVRLLLGVLLDYYADAGRREVLGEMLEQRRPYKRARE